MTSDQTAPVLADAERLDEACRRLTNSEWTCIEAEFPTEEQCAVCQMRGTFAVLRAALEQSQDWQPIETAPKDGTPVRLKWDNTTVEATGRWCPAKDWPKPFATDDWRDVKGDDVLLMPTHWAALRVPAPPLCGVVGEPEAGRKVCQLPKGHEGYHQEGTVRWLGYHPKAAPPEQE